MIRWTDLNLPKKEISFHCKCRKSVLSLLISLRKLKLTYLNFYKNGYNLSLLKLDVTAKIIEKYLNLDFISYNF